MTSEHTSPGARAANGTADRLVQRFSSGDFDSDESRRLTVALQPLSLVLRAVERLARADRVEAWRDVRAAVDAAPRNGLVHALAARLLYVLGDFRHGLDAAQTAWDLGVVSAGMVRYHQARNLGRFDLACAALEDVLRLKERRPSAGISNHVLDYALEHLLALYFDHHHDAAAASTLDRYFSLARGSFSVGLRAARIYDRCGQADKAARAMRDALRSRPSDTPSLLKAATILLEIGAFDEARATYESLLAGPAAPAAVEALGELALWTGDTQRALHHADQLAGPMAAGAAKRIRAAVRVMSGDSWRAVPLLDDALLVDPHDAEAHLWRAEALWRLGESQDALAGAHRTRQYGYSFAAAAIHLLAALPPTGSRDSLGTPVASARAPEPPDRGVSDEVDGAVYHAQQELSAELTALVPGAAELLNTTTMTTSQLAVLLEGALAVMHGNRTRLGTWVRPDGTLVRVPSTAAPRLLSREAFELIRVAPADESFRRLDALAERFPDSSMPVVHRGELHLWLGNYTEARADLERAIAIRRQTRWAWYGLAWLDIVTGDLERGLATCAQGIEVMSNTEGPPAFGCRGEAYRLLGRLDEAREQLQRSCELNPTRLSAWVDLAIVHGAAGDDEQQAAVFARLARVAPALVSHAALELGEDVFTSVVLAAPVGEDTSVARLPPAMIHRLLEQVLVMMRGNRASGLITYFTADGRMHHVPRYGGQPSSRADGQHAVEKLRTVVLRALDGRNR